MRFIVILLILAGCATTETVKLGDGREGHNIRCKEYKSRCLKKATEVCPNGYNAESDVVGTGFLETIYDMVITCK